MISYHTSMRVTIKESNFAKKKYHDNTNKTSNHSQS